MEDDSKNTPAHADQNNPSTFHIETPRNEEGVDNEKPPPLPPRPTNLNLLREGSYIAAESPPNTKLLSRPKLQSTPTIALSRPNIHTQSHPDGSTETYATPKQSTPSGKSWSGLGSVRRLRLRDGSDGDDSASIRSYAPTLEAGGELASLLGENFDSSRQDPGWKTLEAQFEAAGLTDCFNYEEDENLSRFEEEFDELGELDSEGTNEGELLDAWSAKRKHFLILSSAGKPIYSRHGDDNVISGYVAVIQTIISFYENSGDQLRCFTASGVRFVVMAQGPLYLVAISKIGESDAQLRIQLEALYMQILSTLTLPKLIHFFSNRPSTDLRRPLQGTEPLLSALADSFTRGSPPILLSALECLRLRKSQRQVINNTLLGKRCDALLYGLVVAGGRLVSVVRPRRHSLHPSDLQLIFNMLFEAGGIKAGGGENWIPLCLPGFNKNGYLYMYVSFISNQDEEQSEEQSESARPDEVAILLISANKESFYDLRNMRDGVVEVRNLLKPS